MSLVRAQQGEPKREDHLRWSSLFDFLHNREEPHRRSRSVFAMQLTLVLLFDIQEKEVRIITFTPKEDKKAECGKENSTAGKSYKHIELRKNSCLGVRVAGDFSNDNRGGVLNRLKERKYRVEHN